MKDEIALGIRENTSGERRSHAPRGLAPIILFGGISQAVSKEANKLVLNKEH